MKCRELETLRKPEHDSIRSGFLPDVYKKEAV
jgi:hypothetical protein